MKFEDLDLTNYKIWDIANAKIDSVDLSMSDHGVLVLDMHLTGNSWGTIYGGYSLGYGYVGADSFEGSAKGMESIMRIMDTVGVDRFQDLRGKYVRTIYPGNGNPVKIIGNIIEDKWFDIESFYKKEEKNE